MKVNKKTLEILCDIINGETDNTSYRSASQIQSFFERFQDKVKPFNGESRKSYTLSLLNEYNENNQIELCIKAALSPINFIELGEINHKMAMSYFNQFLLFDNLQASCLGRDIIIIPSDSVENKVDTPFFQPRKYHHLIQEICYKYISMGDYFHAVNEASKVYMKQLQVVSNSTADGGKLIGEIFNKENPKILYSKLSNQSEKDFQDGIGFLTRGVVGCFRNTTSHEIESEWKISKDDCEDILSLISFLLRKLDQRVK